MSTEWYTAKIRGYVREARKKKNLEDYNSAGILYQRAARIAHKVNRSPDKYQALALSCFEMQVQNSLGSENFSEAAEALEKIAKIYEDSGDKQLAAELRLQASYLRLRGIETLVN
ncbi:MAG: hypothetical protein ACFFD8_06240 [Candidatus Thorarchaeota archaeon]